MGCVTGVEKRFQAVMPIGRGIGKDRQPNGAETSPLDAARAFAAAINSEKVGIDHDSLQGLAAAHGLEMVELLSTERNVSKDVWEFNGFLVVLAVTGHRAVAAVRLSQTHHADGTEYAQVLRLD
jgi:hypothetical protein